MELFISDIAYKVLLFSTIIYNKRNKYVPSYVSNYHQHTETNDINNTRNY